MKKQLLTTTAALAMVGSAASAQDANLDWGAYFNMDVLYGDVSGSLIGADEDYDGIQTNLNAEVHFKPSITLDNGMTFGAHIELEGNTSGDQIDETYMYVESDTLGRIEIGSENSAGYKLMTGAPGVGGLPINSGSQSAFLPVELGASTVTSTNATTLVQTTTNDIELQETASTVTFGADANFDGETDAAELAAGETLSGVLGNLTTSQVFGITANLGALELAGTGTAVTVADAHNLQNGNALGTAIVSGDTSSLTFVDADGGGLVGPSRFRDAFGSSFTETSGNNDAQRISYYSPSFNGLTFGISYAPDAGEGNGVVDRNTDASDFIDIGVNYSQSFGAMDLTLAARYGTADAEGSTAFFDLDANGDLQNLDDDTDALDTVDVANSDPETWAIGFRLGYDAFTFGASYAENDSGVHMGQGDSEGYSVGMTYDVAGPWSIGAEMYKGEANMGSVINTAVTLSGVSDGSINAAVTTTRERVEAEHTSYKLGATRNLGAGVNWSIYAIQSEQKAKTATRTLADVEGTAIGTSIALNF